jgi:hypothetical protein
MTESPGADAPGLSPRPRNKLDRIMADAPHILLVDDERDIRG